MDKKFCPECQQSGCKSQVYILNTIPVNLSNNFNPIHGYYNEEGFYCDATTAVCGRVGTDFQCSNGHKWTENDYFI